jgi:hypothetical protein
MRSGSRGSCASYARVHRCGFQQNVFDEASASRPVQKGVQSFGAISHQLFDHRDEREHTTRLVQQLLGRKGMAQWRLASVSWLSRLERSFATDTPSDSHGFNWAVTGGILMIIGIVGGVASVVAWVARSYSHRRTTSVTEADGHVVRRDNIDSTQTLGS